jgi:mRNA interferase RelE/StbE
VPYEVRLNRRAQRQLDRIPDGEPERIWDSILELRNNPRSSGALKLRGRALLWRIRVGEYRVVYAIFDPDLLITVDYILRHTTRTYKDIVQ